MKLLVALLVLTLPGIAVAQSVGAAASAPAVEAKPAGNTVSGVTVQAAKPPQKACSSRDNACVEAVVAELKLRYPKELQKWCDMVYRRAAVTNMTIDQLNAMVASPGTRSEAGQFYAPVVTKVACTAVKPEAAKSEAAKFEAGNP